MNRQSFDQVIRACCRHLGRAEVIVIGSQALFGSFDDLPAAGVASMEVDLVLFDEAARDDVAGLFGELSQFHETWGVYADPVEATTGSFPAGWMDRLVATAVPDPERGQVYTARCVEPHDLAVAKLIAGRPKDRALVAAMLATDQVDAARVVDRLAVTPLNDDARAVLVERLRAWSSER